MSGSDDRLEMVEVSVDIQAQPDTVWRCLVEKELLSKWLVADVSLEPRVGGAVRIHFTRYSTVVEGAVTELRAPERLAFTWGVSEGTQAAEMPKGSTRVEIDLRAQGGGTHVTLRHHGLPSEKSRRDHTGGWTAYLASLANVAATARTNGSVDALWDSWFSAWGETDAARRDALLGTCLTTDARFRDAHTEGTGRTWISGWIDTCQKQFPGTRMARAGRVLQTRDAMLVRWNALTPDGNVVARGINHGRLSAEGRLDSIEGFWEAEG